MNKIFSVLFNLKDIKSSRDDDAIDRLSRTYTSTILFIFCLVITSTHYVGRVIECWCPAQFTSSHKAYANSICWVSSTYYVPMEEQIPLDDNHQYVNYYQWVPFILMAQGLLCYVPRLTWKFLAKKAGVNLAHIVDASIFTGKATHLELRIKAIKSVAFQIDRYVKTKEPRPLRLESADSTLSQAAVKCNDCCCIRVKGMQLIAAYLLVKVMYLANAIGQLFLLDVFLGKDFHFFGFEAVHQILLGKDWSFSSRFPRVTLCDFQLRHMTQVHKYIIQCTLPLNIFNEKLFVFIWFWFAMLSIATAYSLLWWCVNIFNLRSNYNFVKMLMKYKYPRVAKNNKDKLVEFYAKYLQKDGVFIVRLLEQVAGVITSAEVTCHLWQMRERNNSNEDSESSKATTLWQALAKRTGSNNNVLSFKEEI